MGQCNGKLNRVECSDVVCHEIELVWILMKFHVSTDLEIKAGRIINESGDVLILNLIKMSVESISISWVF